MTRRCRNFFTVGTYRLITWAVMGFGTLNFADVVRTETEGYDLIVVAPIWNDVLRAKLFMTPIHLTTPNGIPYPTVIACGRQPWQWQSCATGGAV